MGSASGLWMDSKMLLCCSGGLLDGYGWLPVCCYAVIGY